MSEGRHCLIGPHEGREFDLMIAGRKHLSMFVLGAGEDSIDYCDPRFEAHVADGRFIKDERIERLALSNGEEFATRYILYASAEEVWRISAMWAVQDLYLSLLPGRRPDLERLIGTLLGYERAEIEAFVAQFMEPSSSALP